MTTLQEWFELEKQKPYYAKLMQKVNEEYEHYTIFPPKEDIFSCIDLLKNRNVKVVILGQDPYHNDHQANGLAFSVRKDIKIPPSLINIYKECQSDCGCEIPNHGDLSDWAKQGVLLLNNVLTVRAHQANSHHKLGWETFTLHLIQFLSDDESPKVFILWGNNAILKAKYIDSNKHLVLTSAHPSPLSCYRGFFGSKPFSKANEFLIMHHQQPIDWQIKNAQ